MNGAVDDPAILTLSDCLRAAGEEPTIDGYRGVGDTAWYAGAGIPSVFCGPGGVGTAHGVDERASVAELVQATKVFSLMIAAWCGLAR